MDLNPAVGARWEVVVDDREASGGWLWLLGSDPRFRVVADRLSVGDYVVPGVACFERKTIPDFERSLVDGRLFRQASSLASGRVPAAYLLEGSESEWDQCRVRWEALWGAWLSLAFDFRMPVVPVRTPEEGVAVIRMTCERGYPADRGAVRPGYRPRTARRRQLFVLQGLPGIGLEKASRLLDRFGSVRGVMLAEPEAWADVVGIGPETIRRCWQVLG